MLGAPPQEEGAAREGSIRPRAGLAPPVRGAGGNMASPLIFRCPRCGAMNRVASAVGEGSMVVRYVHEYLALT